MPDAPHTPMPTAQERSRPRGFTWLDVCRLGLVQACLGAVIVLTTSTLNRVMVVELGLPALLPGLLLAVHYVVQISRPCMGHGSDQGRRRTPWILGGMLTLALGGMLAAVATVGMASRPGPSVALAVLAFILIGLGVSASGTSLLALLAKRVPEARRAAAATTVWIMMIAGFVVTAGVAGAWLDPYSPERLLAVAGGVSVLAVLLSCLALIGVEGRQQAPEPTPASAVAASGQDRPGFQQAFRQVWAEPQAQRFTVFVFVSMLAFSAQDLVLEPYAGSVFGLTPGGSTRLSGVQHAGALVGMVLAALAGSRWAGQAWGSLRTWTVCGCVAAALALLGLSAGGLVGMAWPLRFNVFLLGLSTGAFSIAAIASMMRLASEGRAGTEGLRVGLWGAAQALAFAAGGVLGTAASDLSHLMWRGQPGLSYALVFALNAALFLWAAQLGARVERPRVAPARHITLRHEHEAAGLL